MAARCSGENMPENMGLLSTANAAFLLRGLIRNEFATYAARSP